MVCSLLQPFKVEGIILKDIIGILDPQHVTETDCWWCLLTQVCIQCIQFMFQYVHIYIRMFNIYILMYVAKSLVILFAFCFPLQVQAAPAEAWAI